jgi:hypothetical protein
MFLGLNCLRMMPECLSDSFRCNTALRRCRFCQHSCRARRRINYAAPPTKLLSAAETAEKRSVSVTTVNSPVLSIAAHQLFGGHFAIRWHINFESSAIACGFTPSLPFAARACQWAWCKRGNTSTDDDPVSQVQRLDALELQSGFVASRGRVWSMREDYGTGA